MVTEHGVFRMATGSGEGSASGRLTSCPFHNSEVAAGWWLPPPVFCFSSCSQRGQSSVTLLRPPHPFSVAENTIPTSPRARDPAGVAAGKATRWCPPVSPPWRCWHVGCGHPVPWVPSPRGVSPSVLTRGPESCRCRCQGVVVRCPTWVRWGEGAVPRVSGLGAPPGGSPAPQRLRRTG